jgi:hypothetical protein
LTASGEVIIHPDDNTKGVVYAVTTSDNVQDANRGDIRRDAALAFGRTPFAVLSSHALLPRRNFEVHWIPARCAGESWAAYAGGADASGTRFDYVSCYYKNHIINALARLGIVYSTSRILQRTML